MCINRLTSAMTDEVLFLVVFVCYDGAAFVTMAAVRETGYSSYTKLLQ